MGKIKTLILVFLFSLVLSIAYAEPDRRIIHGGEIFAARCAPCHGASGEGGVAPALNQTEKLEAFGVENLRMTVAEGRPGTIMPVWGNILSEQEIKDVVTFISVEWGGMRPPVGIEMRPWEIAFVSFGGILLVLGIYYVIRP